MADTREMLALVVCNATQKTNYKCEFDCEKKGKCAYCLIMAEQMIANGVTVTDNNVGGKWISVKERLPDDRSRVLCYTSTGIGLYPRIARFANCLEDFHEYDFEGAKHCGFYEYDSDVGYYEVINITHWMPLPEPPKGE